MGAHVKRAQLTVVGLTALSLAATALVTAPASQGATQAVTAPIDCPKAFPTTDAVDGVEGTGFTVSKGRTPEPFSAKVIGRLTDGIFPGVDMIMAEVSSPALTKAGGVWAGMSGSPVYAEDGRLIGAVAYGLSFGPTNIAGITPAEAMFPLLDGPTTAAARSRGAASRVAVPSAVAARIAARTGVSTQAAAGGFERLQLPVMVSGGNSKARQKLMDRLAKRFDDVRFVTAASAESSTASPASIVAGGNFVAAISYGDITFAGAGTTTFVCGTRAVAFGHPFFALAPMTLSAHDSTAVYVQPDPVFGPYKLVNPGGVVGTVDTDAIPGISARLGVAPPTMKVTASITKGTTKVKGTSRGVFDLFHGDVAANQVYVSILKAFNTRSGGSAAIKTTIKGVRANGKPFTLSYSDHYADPLNVAYDVADATYASVDRLVSQEFEDVRLTSVDVSGSVESTVRLYSVGSVKVKQGGSYVKPKGTLKVKAGKKLPVRLTLDAYKGRLPDLTVTMSVPAPAKAKGKTGTLAVSAGADEFWFEDEETSSPKNFSQLLAELRNEARNDQVRGDLVFSDKLQGHALAIVNGEVSGYSDEWSARAL